MSFIILALLFGIISVSNACTFLEANNETVGYIDSHDTFGTNNYPHNQEICWVITAEEGFAIALWSDFFDLESRYDTVEIYCGEHGDDGYIGEYSGHHGININAPVYTGGEAMFIEFISDYSIAEEGFRLNYTAVPLSEAGEGHCDADYDSDETTEHHHYGAGAVAGIVFGVILLVAFLGVVAACVVCCVCSMKTRPQRIVGNYPMNAYPGMTPVGAVGGMGATGGMAPPPAYASAQTGSPFASAPGQPQLYGQPGKDPSQLGPAYGAPPPMSQSQGHNGFTTSQGRSEGTFSPPPSYEPTQSTGHL